RNAQRITRDRASADRRSAKPRRGARHRFYRVDAGAQSIAFVAEKEEELVFDDRAPKRAAKLIQPQRSFLPDDIVEEVCCVERVVAEVFEQRTVKSVAARLRNDTDLPAGAGP